jgi:hypothetical protein
MQMGVSARSRVSCAFGDEEGCPARRRAAPFCARSACTRPRSLAADPFRCKHEAESGVSAQSARPLIGHPCWCWCLDRRRARASTIERSHGAPRACASPRIRPPPFPSGRSQSRLPAEIAGDRLGDISIAARTGCRASKRSRSASRRRPALHRQIMCSARRHARPGFGDWRVRRWSAAEARLGPRAAAFWRPSPGQGRIGLGESTPLSPFLGSSRLADLDGFRSA